MEIDEIRESWTDHERGHEHIQILLAHIDELEDKLQKIKNWCDAYPLEVFPEPDLDEVAFILKENGMTLDAVSASNMRHVLNGIKDIVDQ